MGFDLSHLRLLLTVQVVDQLVALVDDGHELFEQQLFAQLLRFRFLPICEKIKTFRNNRDNIHVLFSMGNGAFNTHDLHPI